jgi:hypothetical protein
MFNPVPPVRTTCSADGPTSAASALLAGAAGGVVFGELWAGVRAARTPKTITEATATPASNRTSGPNLMDKYMAGLPSTASSAGAADPTTESGVPGERRSSVVADELGMSVKYRPAHSFCNSH